MEANYGDSIACLKMYAQERTLSGPYHNENQIHIAHRTL